MYGDLSTAVVDVLMYSNGNDEPDEVIGRRSKLHEERVLLLRWQRIVTGSKKSA